MIVGTLLSNVPLATWGLFVTALGGGSVLWVRLAWRGVEVEVRLPRTRAFARERVPVVVRVENRKRIRLPRVLVKVPLPLELRPATDKQEGLVEHVLRWELDVPAHSESTSTLFVESRGRGEFRLEDSEAVVVDPFGLAPVERPLPPLELLVLPEPTIPIPVEVRRRLPFGAPTPRLVMFEQPERFAGVRPYLPGDPLNQIHWKLTGHSGQLQTKLFEPTRSAELLLAVDLAVGEPFWSSANPEIAEETIGWASFLARLALEAGWRVALIANTHLTQGRGPLRVPASSARGHEAALFAAMARMPNQPTADMAPWIRDTGQRLGVGSTVVVLSPRPGPWLRQEMVSLERRGVRVVQVSPLDVVGTKASA